MKILVTGTEGYIGSILAPILMKAGHEVTGLDTGFYRDGWLYSNHKDTPIQPKMINKDIRHIEAPDLEGFDAVVHMAELSNDPLGQNNPEVTHKINHLSSVRIAKICKNLGIERFVYTSSCSVMVLVVVIFLTKHLRSIPRRHMQYAKPMSKEMCLNLPTIILVRFICAIRQLMAPHQECALISC